MEFLESKFLYLGLLISTLAFPFMYSFENRIEYYKKWKSLLPSIIIMMLIFIPWDIYFTERGVWYFNHKYILEYKLIQLPAEEWLFFIIVPFSCVFIYEACNYFFKKGISEKQAGLIFIVISFILTTLAIIYSKRIYTFTVCGLSGITSIAAAYFKPHWGGKFLRLYFISWLPFLAVNGILTGSLLQEAVVNYNHSEIIGFRIFTIPVEDSIYNFLMLIVVVGTYELFKKRMI